MARVDVGVDVTCGELILNSNIAKQKLIQFVWLERKDESYCYGEFVIPIEQLNDIQDGFEIYSYIPYKAVNLPLKIRIKTKETDDNEVWHEVVLPDNERINICNYLSISSDFLFNLVRVSDSFHLYSASKTDIQIVESLHQNQAFLLKTSHGQNFQHPQAGVGLVDFLHSNFEKNGLAQKLQVEFEADKMVVDDAYINSETGELLLNVREMGG